jgi:predicted nucleotidyltransferase
VTIYPPVPPASPAWPASSACRCWSSRAVAPALQRFLTDWLPQLHERAAAQGPGALGHRRRQLVSSLRAWLDRDPRVRAAWEGGSAAFDDVDEWSDVDAIVVVADDAVDAVFDDLERSLGALSPIAHRHDIPATSGYTQRFYRLRDAGEFLVLDLVLIRQSDPLLFREVELHGRGRTWLDRDGRLDERHLDRDADLEQARQRLAPLRSGFEMFQHLVIKECRRGRACEPQSL